MEYQQSFKIERKGEDETVFMHFCTNPACPNYGLLQVPEETMIDIYEKENKI
jgi:hypothetical protein